MITHNGKQVTLAMRNRKAINLIARNGKAMWEAMYGIDAAAKAVILAEYGKQVWSDVKQYAKAHPAIVPFINQDPHLAASISTNSNKERWLVGDGMAWIQTSIVTTITTSAHMRFKTGTISGALMGGNNWSTNSWLTQFSSNTIRWHWASGVLNPPIAANTIYDAIFAANYIKLNDVERTGSGASKVGEKVQLFACTTTRCNAHIARVQFKDGEEIVGDYVPYPLPDGTYGMLDMVTCQLFANANTQGQFTIAITDKE